MINNTLSTFRCVFIAMFMFININTTSAQYCITSGETNFNTSITYVQFNTINNSTAKPSGYSDYTSISTTVVQNSSYDLSVNLNTDGTWTIHAVAWIDWNQNNDFSDPGETYDLGTTTNNSNGITTLSPLSISIPVTATLGTTRMRISAKYNVDPTPCDPTLFDGEAEDYSIIVNPPIPAPEIDVLGNNLSIADGDTTPSLLDDTAHGILTVGNTSSKIYTIENTGNLNLDITDITLSNSTDFSITGTPYDATVNSLGSTNFEVTFNSLLEGTKTTTVTITNNDNDEPSYQFDITATAEDNEAILTDFTAGAAIIDMGIEPQTINNGLRPYGLIQELVSVHEIPVYWIIDDAKSFVSGTNKVDQTDLTITGTVSSDPSSAGITTDLKSGPFLIQSEFIPLAQSVIESWIGTSSGAGTDKLTVYWNLDAITDAPVHGIITYFPNVTLYPIGGDPSSTAPTDMETAFYTPAGIVDGFTKKAPDELGSCDLIYVLSHHTDPDTDWSQADINTFYDFILGGGNSWLGCHDVSLTENVLTTTSDAGNPTRGNNQLNFLSNGGLLPYTTLSNISTNYPWLSAFADAGNDILEHDNTFVNADILYDITTAPDPLMQFMGENHPAMNGNSEHIYVPLADAGGAEGGWRSTTTVSVYDSNNSQIPSRSPGRAGVVVYGPAFGNTDFGTLLYQGSHISSGNDVSNWDSEHIGELRLFANFLLESALEVTPGISIPELPFAPDECGDTCVSVNATIDNIPHPNNTYLWEYEVLSGTTTAPVTFAPNNAASTTICFPQNIGEVIFKITFTFTSTPNGGCDNPITSKYISVVTVNEATIADAGTDQILNCGLTSTILEATNNTGYIGTWSVVSGSGANISDVNDPNTLFTGIKSEIYVLRWSITCAEDDVQISMGNGCNGIDFDGINDNITFDDNYNFNSEFSIELWVKPNSIVGNQSIISKRDLNDFSTGYDLKLVNNTLSFNWNNSGTISSPYALETNRWYHTAITYDGTNYRLYIDGIEINTEIGDLPTTNNFDCIAGAMSQSTTPPYYPINYFNGWLDELRIWNTALTLVQIRQMMNQEIQVNGTAVRGSTVPLDISGLNWGEDLTGYYQMNQNTDIVDGNLNEITINAITGKLRNITSWQEETTPLPYTTKANGLWNDNTASTPWTYGDSVWNIPNSLGIDNTTIINWNIVETNHNTTINTFSVLGRERTVLGLIVSSNKLEVDGDSSGISRFSEPDTGNGLTVTDYLKIDGVIDLEGESQLIQPLGSVLDTSGTGVLERDQQGTADTYTYNYWSSPVGIINEGTSNYSYKLSQILKDGIQDINFITSGYNGAIGPPIGIADYWIWKFANQLDNDYASWQHVRSTSDIYAGEGFTMKGPGTGNVIDNQNYVFNGKPNNGNITLSINTGNDYLVGNPYSSAIDANKFILDNSDTTGALYYWEHFGGGTHNTIEYQGGYAVYNLSGGIPAIQYDYSTGGSDPSGGTGLKTPGRYIPVAQGFFVIGNANGTINFNNSQRIFKKENESSVFVRSSNRASTRSFNDEADNRLKIRLSFESSDTLKRQLLITRDSQATNQIDFGYDAVNKDLQTNDMFWIINNDKFVIQGTNIIDMSTILPIGILTNTNGINIFKIDALENVPSDLDIFIHDKSLQTFHNLRSSDFHIDLPAGEYLDRFEITFTNQSLLVNAVEDAIINFYYLNESNHIVIYNPKNSEINSVEIINMLGQVVIKYNNIDSKSTVQLKTKKLSVGTYFLKLISESRHITKKVLIK